MSSSASKDSMPTSISDHESEEEFISAGIDDLVEAEKNYQVLHKCNTSLTSCATGAGLGNSTSATMETLPIPLDYMKIVVLSMIIILTVLGNLAVIAAISARAAKMTRMYYFILHLSLADLLTAFLTLVPEVAWTFTMPNFYGGAALCKLVKFTQMLGPYLSSYVLIMTAVDRYQAICNPLGNCTWTPRRSQIMITVAWLISLMLCLPQAFIFDFEGSRCSAHFAPGWGVQAYVCWFSVSNFFIPLVILLFCYSRICYVIWDNVNSKATNSGITRRPLWKRLKRYVKSHEMRRKSTTETEPSCMTTIKDDSNTEVLVSHHPDAISKLQRRSSDSQSSDSSIESADQKRFQARDNLRMERLNRTRITFEPPSNEQGRQESVKPIRPRIHTIKNISRAKIKTVKLTVVVIMGYIICSAPFICVQLWATFGSPSSSIMSSMKFLFWLLTLNSVVNPWIYMMFNANLVESLQRLCCPGCYEPRVHANRRAQRNRGAFFNLKKGSSKSRSADQARRKSRSVSPVNTCRSVTITTSVYPPTNHLIIRASPESSRGTSPCRNGRTTGTAF